MDNRTPISFLKGYIKENKIKQQDLIPLMGTKSIVSEVLNCKRKLTLEMIRNLNQCFHI